MNGAANIEALIAWQENYYVFSEVDQERDKSYGFTKKEF